MALMLYWICQGSSIFGNERIAEFKKEIIKVTNIRTIFLFCVQYIHFIQTCSIMFSTPPPGLWVQHLVFLIFMILLKKLLLVFT